MRRQHHGQPRHPLWDRRSFSRRERRDADLFYADLIGRPIRASGPAGQPDEASPMEQTAPAPAIVPVFPGLDVSAWDGKLVWLWRWSNLRFAGFYLAHHAGQARTTWTDHWHDLQDLGWGLVPFYLPFSSGGIAGMSAADGTAHGHEAVALARGARIETGAAIYLDIEAPVLGAGADPGFARYINNWFAAVRAGGYTPGTYCSRLDASAILGGAFRANHPVLFPFSIPKRTRAQWDDDRHELVAPLPSTWDVGRDPAWAPDASTIGCQYDWFNGQRDRTEFHWPTPTGANGTGRSVDWDAAKVWNPSHPRAGAVVAAAVDRDTEGLVRIFTAATDRLQFRDAPAGPIPAARDLGLGPADIGPTPGTTESGYDAVFAAACSRRGGCADLFVQGLDGLVRTIWINSSETFPRHPWPLSTQPARRGTPLAAVCREVDQIDVFYVNREHQLVTQWWNRQALTWPRRVLAGPAVAGGSNLAAVKRAAGDSERSQLDVFYVSLDHTRPYAAPAQWNDAWRVIHATWTQQSDWRLTPVRGLDQPAAASGVAAAGDAWGRLNVIVQTRDRQRLRHGSRTALTGSTFDVIDGPVLPAADNTPMWWTTFSLAVFPHLLLLVGVTNTGALAWATHTPGVWSRTQTGPATFATGRPLALARRGGGVLAVLGIAEDGGFVSRVLQVAADGRVTLQP